MSRGLVLLACAALGCLREPTFKGIRDDAAIDAPSDAAVDAPDASTMACMDTPDTMTAVPSGMMNRGATVCGPGYRMEFSDIGAKFPHLLVVGGMFLAGRGESCNDERGVGVALFPASLINGEPHTGVEGTLSLRLSGPAVAKVVIDWSADYSCQTTGTLQDRTSFTFFPDGRITRWDRLRQTEQVAGGGCTVCSQGGNSNTFFLTSYTALAAGSDAVLTGASIETLTSYGQSASGLQSACLTTLGRRVAFGWRDTSTRIRVADDSPRTLAFIQDVIRDAPSLGPDLSDDVTTHMLVSSTTACADLRARALQHANRPNLTLTFADDMTDQIGPSPDGIYGGERADGTDGYDPRIGAVRISPTSTTIPGNFAVWLDFGAQANQNVAVTHNNAPSGDWFQIQRVTTSEVIFWFRDDLAVGERITITPQ